MNKSNDNVITCICGAEIPDSSIDWFNSTNEEGEEYGIAEATCATCRKEYEVSTWGEIEGIDDAKDLIKDEIEGKM